MKISIGKELTVRLLQAIRDGVFDTDKFPEFATIIWNETSTYAPEFDLSTLTDKERELLRELEEKL